MARAPFDGNVRRKPLSVVIRDLPADQLRLRPGTSVLVDLGYGVRVPGTVMHPLGWAAIRVALEVEP